MQRSIARICGYLALATLAAACANVAPAHRGVLAKPAMRFDPDAAHVKVTDQIYAAREAASGGRVTGGGGCGCTM